MTKEELAAKLNGRQYGDEITVEEYENAKHYGLIVVFGYSDDNLELRGAIYDELGAYDGRKYGIKIGKHSGLPKICKPTKSDHFIDAVWCPQEIDCSWIIKTNLPHATFDIRDNDELFCRGIVIDVKDLTTHNIF